MSSRTVKYTAGEIGRVRVVADFLPAPDALVAREENVKVTLELSQRRFLQARRQGAARALSAHDPRAGRCLCGEAEGGVRRPQCVLF
ncbi:MAG: hypothetical protein PSV22_07695 [Pseudolabrys sp.]|nr:hypothetical protein [Pseudolabrys sp.]